MTNAGSFVVATLGAFLLCLLLVARESPAVRRNLSAVPSAKCDDWSSFNTLLKEKHPCNSPEECKTKLAELLQSDAALKFLFDKKQVAYATDDAKYRTNSPVYGYMNPDFALVGKPIQALTPQIEKYKPLPEFAAKFPTLTIAGTLKVEIV
jgi:hypothetical protein